MKHDERPDFHAMVREFVVREDDESIQRMAKALEAEQREERLIESGISGVITDRDVAAIVRNQDIAPTVPVRACERWIQARLEARRPLFSTLVMLGQPGRGKTFAAAWLISRIGGRFITAESLRRCVTVRAPQVARASRLAILSRHEA